MEKQDEKLLSSLVFFGGGGKQRFEHRFPKEHSHHPSLPFPALDVSQVGGGLRDQRDAPSHGSSLQKLQWND